MTRSKPPRLRENREIRRAQLIDEAIRLIGRQGYHGFTVQALAAQSGLTNAGVLHHFASKDLLLLAVLDEIERREGERVALLLARHEAQGAGAGAEAALPVLRAMMRLTAANPEQARFLAALQAESMDPAHPAHRWFGEREIETAELFTRLAAAHGDAAPATARQLIALMYGLLMQWLRTEQGFDLVAEWTQAAKTVLRAQPSKL